MRSDFILENCTAPRARRDSASVSSWAAKTAKSPEPTKPESPCCSGSFAVFAAQDDTRLFAAQDDTRLFAAQDDTKFFAAQDHTCAERPKSVELRA